MLYINLISIFSALIFGLAFVMMRTSYINRTKKLPKLTNQMIVFLIFALAIIVRMLCAFNFQNHADLECFEYWGRVLYDNGFGKFYDAAGNADYPPGYMYVLWLLTVIKNVLNFEHGSKAALFIIKIIPMICDLGTGLFLYKVATRKFNNIASYAILICYLFNPGVILNSSVWGQVDSVFMLGILLMCYYATTNKSYLCYTFYVLAILIKPQAIMFTPIIMMVFVNEIFINAEGRKLLTFRKEEFVKHLAWITGTLCSFVIACIPFGLVRVLKQYTTTMGSYEYASVNAYNFWSMFGLNWVSQEEMLFGITYKQWGIIVIVAICLLAAFMWISKLNDKKRYISIAIFICAAMFTFSVRMHERYVYPAVILLLLLFILNKQVSVIALYFAYSIAHFYNVAHVLYYYDPKNFDQRTPAYIILGLVHVIIFVFLYRYIHRNYISLDCDMVTNALIDKIYNKNMLKEEGISLWARIKKQFNREEIQRSKVYEKFNKKDWIILAIITVVYSACALYDLGDMDAPQTMWSTDKKGTVIKIELEKKEHIKEIAFYNGYWATEEYEVEMRNKKGGNPTYSSEQIYGEAKKDENKRPDEENAGLIMNSVFCWDKWDIDAQGKIIELRPQSADAAIGELVIINSEGEIVRPKNADSKELKALFDEQKKYPKEFSYKNSTYFDEIYHARTAYEFIHGLPTYEWTHPPLGKIFISLGVRIFGMCPFGWRIIGTIFGILMVPLIYVFAKRLFGKTSISTIICLMLTFDFMHLAQTRIATIDVYVTFFVILMYYFMYKYYEMSFYDTKLGKTFIPLLLSGMAMGLGIASKWTGCYAAVGLAIIFFYTVFKRHKEYKYALQDTTGITNGIKHEHIINVYKGNLTKTILFCFIAFIGIPLVIYTMSYIPFIGDERCPNTAFGKMLYNINQMFTYHTNVKFEHGFSSRWFEWPLMIRPIFYYSGISPKEGMAAGISAFGNPLVWWFGIASFIYICYRLFAKKDRYAWFFFVGYLAQLMPWVLVERLTFIYHYFPCVPFVVLMNGYVIYRLVKDKPKRLKYAYIYAALVVVAFIMFYPVLTGKTVAVSYVTNCLRWVKTWVLISG